VERLMPEAAAESGERRRRPGNGEAERGEVSWRPQIHALDVRRPP